jgi:hypothetical protein
MRGALFVSVFPNRQESVSSFLTVFGFLTVTPKPTGIIKVFPVGFDSADRNYSISCRFSESRQE